MPTVSLPAPGRPYVLIEADGTRDVLALERDEIVSLYKEHGALLLRGFATDVEAFGRFARQFCATSVVNESPGRRMLDAERNVLTVDGGTGAFNFHPELSREPWKPDAAFFGCLSAPLAGGATTICDGVELVRALPAEVRQGLEGRRLLYIKPTWPGLLEFWLGTPDPTDAQLLSPPENCPYFFRKLHGEIVRLFTRPALHRPMFTDQPAFGNFLLFARFNNRRPDFPLLDDGRPVLEAWLQAIRATAERVGVAIAWRKGDVLMLDNTRFMHGRTAITEPGERLIATFFGYVDFAERDPEEPPQPLWRQRDFMPPLPPDW
ncbi:alpha-ketoglutarate-dependent taurine dioxygenase [Novosphingobium chloroacetimidivorans]|uniref:Alpha-ketoglutarate-dependent taurine dioxygenase n=1 Tax=Novosphingobium chloroacetimidivorans TaxID=1428314 RepID=A0A7W7KCD7_9SPHN|nr:TauD/TfdA family dioxygenase [Novosphingobium chloroacetimidivorans]MBB4860247.1 alpha-ketoglutarate-dependent taurine dioxygenase [Novosphingobium chloroacetimidivorans]